MFFENWFFQFFIGYLFFELKLIYVMPSFSIYKEIQPTYGEWLPILERLGFQKQVVDIEKPISKKYTKQYRLVNQAEKSIILLPFRPDDAPVLKAHFANYSIQLYYQGIIEDMQDMAKMIDQNRMNAEMLQH